MSQDLSIVIPTYKRPDIVSQTIRALIKNLRYEIGKFRFLLGVDGKDDATYQALERVGNVAEKYGHDFSVFDGPGRGLGANLNMLLRKVETRMVLQLDDDHVLMRPLTVDGYAYNLLTDEHMQHGWIRLMYGVCTDPSGYYHFHGQLYGHYWRLTPNAGELYLPSNRPHIKSISFHDFVGYYNEDVTLGQTEIAFCAKYARHAEEKEERGEWYPSIFIPMYPPPELTWDHVGESWQKEGL